jgi:hypothetical protein
MRSQAMPYGTFMAARKTPALQELECTYEYLYVPRFANPSDRGAFSVAGIRTVTYQQLYVRAIMAMKLPAKSQRVRRIPSAPLRVCRSSR